MYKYGPGQHLFLILLLLPLGQESWCQEIPSDKGVLHTIGSDITISVEDGLSFFSAPFRFTGKDWVLAGAGLAGTTGLLSADRATRRLLSVRGEEELGGSFWQIPTYYGDIDYATLLSAGLYVAGLGMGMDEIRVTGRLALESLFLAGSTLLVLRYASARSGPGIENDPWDFKGFRWDRDRQAFPSGWSTTAFALSTVLAERLDHPVARVGFYGIALLASYARVRFDQHWTSDVVLGGALGLAAGFHVVCRERNREKTTEKGEGFSFEAAPGRIVFRYALR